MKQRSNGYLRMTAFVPALVSWACMVTLLAACASDPPATPPTPLKSIKSVVAASSQWRVAIGKKDESPGNGFSPFADGDSVFAASTDGVVIKVNAASGKNQWRRELGKTLVSGVGGDDTQVYVATRDGEITALLRATGKTAWVFSMSSEVLVPLSASDGLLVVRAADGRVTAIDSASGKQKWTTTFEPPALTITGYSQPLILSNGVLVGLDDGKLAALSLEQGELLWVSVISYPSGRSEIERLVDVDANILIDDAFIYAVSYQGKLARVEPARGSIAWSVDFSSTVGMTQSSDRLFLTDSQSRVVAIDKNSGETVWTLEKLVGRSLTKPVLAGSDSIAVADFEGYVHLISVRDGTLVGRSRPLETAARGVPVVQGNQLFLQSRKGKLVSVKLPAAESGG